MNHTQAKKLKQLAITAHTLLNKSGDICDAMEAIAVFEDYYNELYAIARCEGRVHGMPKCLDLMKVSSDDLPSAIDEEIDRVFGVFSVTGVGFFAVKNPGSGDLRLIDDKVPADRCVIL